MIGSYLKEMRECLHSKTMTIAELPVRISYWYNGIYSAMVALRKLDGKLTQPVARKPFPVKTNTYYWYRSTEWIPEKPDQICYRYHDKILAFLNYHSNGQIKESYWDDGWVTEHIVFLREAVHPDPLKGAVP